MLKSHLNHLSYHSDVLFYILALTMSTCLNELSCYPVIGCLDICRELRAVEERYITKGLVSVSQGITVMSTTE